MESQIAQSIRLKLFKTKKKLVTGNNTVTTEAVFLIFVQVDNYKKKLINHLTLY